MGRHREFDADLALDAAMKVFWTRGYEGASLSELTRAMGISRTSLYAAFGNKEALFLKALARYERLQLCFLSDALDQPTAHGVLRRLLTGAANAHTDVPNPPGCMIIISAMGASEAAGEIKDELIRRRSLMETRLRIRLVQAQTQGDLPADSDPADLARYAVNIVYGMAVQAASGTSRSELLRVVELALRTLRLA